MPIETRSDYVDLPDAPRIPGLRFRPFRGEADFAAMAAVAAACKEVDRVEHGITAESIAFDFAYWSDFEPQRDVLLAEIESATIGISHVDWWRELSGNYMFTVFGRLDPAWRRRGIGGALPRWSEGRAREIAAGHPPDGKRFLQSTWSDVAPSRQFLLESAGYRPVTHFADMRRPHLDDIPEAALPAGLEVRPVMPEHYRAIWEADVEAFQDHWGSSSPDEKEYQRFLKEPTFDPTLWKIAWDGQQVAGQVKSYIDAPENEEFGRRRGYAENISVRRPWRRQGLARALLAESLYALKQRGMEEAALGVHFENPRQALRLYESVGFAVVRMNTTVRKPLD